MLLSANAIATTVPDTSIESFLGLPSGTLDALSPDDATTGSAIKGSFNIQSGDTFSFDWLWTTDEEPNNLEFNDFSFYSLSLDGNGILADTFTPNGTLGAFSWTATTSGLLSFGIGVMDVNDEVVPSFLTVSNLSNGSASISSIGDVINNGGGSYSLSTANAVPIPATVWLFFSGLIGIIGIRKKD